jgi:hypothetical protein
MEYVKKTPQPQDGAKKRAKKAKKALTSEQKAKKKMARKKRNLDGEPTRKDFKARNRKLISELENGMAEDKLQHLKKLVKAMKRNGVALRSVMDPQDISANVVQTHPVNSLSKPILNYNSKAAGDPIDNFMMSLQTPGVHDVPFIDPSQVTPLPHGVLTGLPQLVSGISTSVYAGIFICPALAFSIATSVTNQYPGISFQSYANTASGITDAQIAGVGGSWTSFWGNSTAATRIVPWSIAVDIVLRIPEAVVQGNFWIGNAPLRTISGGNLGNLLQMSESINAERGGATYTIKASLTDRGLIHSPYGALVETDAGVPTINYPGEERVSWIFFSPNSVGSIAGAPPATWDFQYVPRCNYLWIPAFQPQVIGTTIGQVSGDSRKVLDPFRKAHLEVDSNLEATNPHDPQSDMSSWCKGYVRDRLEANLATTSLGGGMVEVTDPLASVAVFDTMLADIEYYQSSINLRWGDWSAYGEQISQAIISVSDSFEKLKTLLKAQDARSRDLLSDFQGGTISMNYEKGVPRFRRVSASGKILETPLKKSIPRSPSVESGLSSGCSFRRQ